MATHNVYEVHLRDGRTVLVVTPRHHSNHDQDEWTQHIVALLRELAIHVAAHEISRVMHKGHR